MDFRKWRETRPSDYWWNLSITAHMAYMEDRFNYNSGTQIFTLGNKTVDFTKFTEYPIGPAEAFAYFGYLRWCKKKGQEPGPYVNPHDYEENETDSLLTDD